MKTHWYLAAFVVLMVVRAASAQTPMLNPTGTIPPLHGPLPTGSIPGSLPTTSSSIPLPRIGLPLPSIGLPPVGVNRGINNRRVHDRGFSRSVIGTTVVGGGFFWPNVVYVMPDSSLFAPASVLPPAPAPEPAPPKASPTGYLVPEIQPGSAEIFVDGYYVGTADDVRSQRGELVLEPGPHAVRIDAAGYEPLNFNVRIAANETIRYRHDLAAVSGTAAPVAAAAPVKSKTFYMIPGCYLGDIPPKDAGLPETCDASAARTFEVPGR